MRNIHVIMTREDGEEEGNQWEFEGSDDQLYDLFEILCQEIIHYPQTKLPEPSEGKRFGF